MTPLLFYARGCAVASAILCACVPPAHSLARRAEFPVLNEKIYLSPVIDSSSLDQFPGWPVDKTLETPLKRHFQKMDSSLFVEFRRSEKFGLYEMVDDSLSSGVAVTFVVKHFQFKKDTLLLPVHMKAEQWSTHRTYTQSLDGYGIYRAKSAPKSQLHYIDVLLADFCRNFPYKNAAGVFYMPSGTPQPLRQR